MAEKTEKKVKLDADDQPIVWHEIDPATLTGNVLKAWQAFRAQYDILKKQREEFEALLHKSANLPAGRRLIVSYRFGKLTVANVVDEGRSRTSRKPVSMAAIFGNGGKDGGKESSKEK